MSDLRAVPAPTLDGDRVLEHLADLERERAIAQGVVDHVADLLDSCERSLTALDHRIAALRSHPSVIAALADVPARGSS
jgi:hypothetical protein